MYRLISNTALLSLSHCHPAYTMIRAASTGAANTKLSRPNIYAAGAVREKGDISDDDKATPEQLAIVSDKLTKHLPRFFVDRHDFSLYTKDVVLIDNIRNIRSTGIPAYLIQISLVRIYHHVNYSSVRLELLNLVKHPEESCIKIRWRIVRKPGLFRTYLLLFSIKQSWVDGLSTMYVNKDGKIYCHVCDNIDVETDTKIKKDIKDPVVI